MLKKLAISGVIAMGILAAPELMACDACGCGIGSYQFGILPQLNKNFAGVRYQRKTDRTTPIHGSQSRETFQTTEFWGRFYPAKRVQVFALVPYQFNSQATETRTISTQGLGDVLVLANYNLLNNTDSLYQKVKHNLLVGGGLKLATGKNDKVSEGAVLNPNLQLGSGSFDFVSNVIYTVRYNKIGLNTDATFKLNTANQNQFHFGNRFGASARLFSVLKVKECALMPNAGLSTEVIGKDRHYGTEVKESGGKATFLNLGTEAYYKSFAIGGSFQKPVSQHLSEGYVETGNRVLAHVTFMF